MLRSICLTHHKYSPMMSRSEAVIHMLLRMARVQIIGAKPHQAQAVELLQRLGLVQIDHWQEAKALTYRRMNLDDAALDRR